MVHKIVPRICQEKTEEVKCIWKGIAGREGQVEGRFRNCKSSCDGYKSNCEYYISQFELRIRRNR